MSDELDGLFDLLAEHDLPRPSVEEIDAILDLARLVAHATVRRGAPLACYAAGLALTAATDPAEREERLRALIAAMAPDTEPDNEPDTEPGA